MMRIFISSLLAAALAASAFQVHAKLAKDWRTKYTPGDTWQSTCAYETGGRGCPAANTYLYKENKALVQLSTSGRPKGYHHFFIVPFEGKCSGGSVDIDGEKRFDLESYRDHCRVAGDLTFIDEGMGPKPKTLPVSMLVNAGQLEITLKTADGKQSQLTIPMAGFSAAYKHSRDMVGSR